MWFYTVLMSFERDRQREGGKQNIPVQHKRIFFFFYVTKQASQQHTYSLWKVMTAEQERAMIRKLIKLTCLYNSLLTLKWESNSTMLLNAFKFNTILTLIFVHQLTSPPPPTKKAEKMSGVFNFINKSYTNMVTDSNKAKFSQMLILWQSLHFHKKCHLQKYTPSLEEEGNY